MVTWLWHHNPNNLQEGAYVWKECQHGFPLHSAALKNEAWCNCLYNINNYIYLVRWHNLNRILKILTSEDNVYLCLFHLFLKYKNIYTYYPTHQIMIKQTPRCLLCSLRKKILLTPSLTHLPEKGNYNSEICVYYFLDFYYIYSIWIYITHNVIWIYLKMYISLKNVY